MIGFLLVLELQCDTNHFHEVEGVWQSQFEHVHPTLLPSLWRLSYKEGTITLYLEVVKYPVELST